MRKHVAICLFCFAMIISTDIKAQALINWEWQNVTNLSYSDIEFKNNFIYAVGNFTANSVTIGTNTYLNAGGSDIIICKMDTLGNIIWSQHFGSSNHELLNSICVDNNDNVIAIGSMQGSLNVGSTTLTSVGGVDLLMIKCGPTGNVLLAKNVGTLGYDEGYDITTDYNNDIYAVGRKDTNNLIFAATNNTYRNAIFKWSSSGTEVSMQYMRGGLTGLPGYATTTLIKYSEFDSTLIIGGGFSTGGSPTTYYSICHSSNTSLYATLYASASWGPTNGYYFCKTNLNGIAQKLYGCAPSYASGIYDLATNPANGDFYYSTRVHYPLSLSDYNGWVKGDTSFTNFTSLPIYLTSNPMPISGQNGAPLKINYYDNSVYGLLYQTHLTSNVSCSDYYSATLNLNTNVSELKNLDYGQEYISGVGFNGTFCMGSTNTIGKSCQANCAVPAYSLNSAPDTSNCGGSTIKIGFPECYYVKGGTAPYTFSWSPAIGLNASNIPQPYVSGLTANTTYTLTVTDAGGYVVYDTVNVNLININYGNSSDTACSFYNWAGYNFYTSGVYTYTFTNANGCDSIHTLNLIVNLSNNITLYVFACGSYNWNGIVYTANGFHTDTFTNINGCDSIINLSLAIYTIDTSIVQVSNSLTANEVGATYQWLSCNPYAIIIGATNQSYMATANGDYAVIISKNACTDTSSCYQVSGVYVDNLIQENQFLVYPNPTHSIIYIQVQHTDFNKSNNEVLLCNTLGQVLQKQIINSNGKAEFNISHLSAGLYYIRSNGYSKKIIKE